MKKAIITGAGGFIGQNLVRYLLNTGKYKLVLNYLSEKEIRQLERTVSGYFDYIEDLIERENTFTMTEFAESVNEFLSFRRYQILKDHGKISRQQALEKAGKEYDIFNKIQVIESDFDKEIKHLTENRSDSRVDS